MRIVVITGASNGIGLAAAQLFRSRGDKVYCLSRTPCHDRQIGSLSCDITNEGDIASAIKTIADRENSIDVLICNAGFGISGAVEFTDIELAKKQFDVNFFGNMNVMRHVLPIMRRQHGGHIIVTSSVAGMLSIPFQAYYSASKAALNSLVLATANEVRDTGIKVAAVLPGDIRTGFTAAREKLEAGEESYSSLKKSVASMERDEQNGMPPIAIAKAMYRISTRKSPKPLSSVGIKYKACCFLGKVLPTRLSNWIVGKMYS